MAHEQSSKDTVEKKRTRKVKRDGQRGGMLREKQDLQQFPDDSRSHDQMTDDEEEELEKEREEDEGGVVGTRKKPQPHYNR